MLTICGLIGLPVIGFGGYLLWHAAWSKGYKVAKDRDNANLDAAKREGYNKGVQDEGERAAEQRRIDKETAEQARISFGRAEFVRGKIVQGAQDIEAMKAEFARGLAEGAQGCADKIKVGYNQGKKDALAGGIEVAETREVPSVKKASAKKGVKK